MNNDNYKTENKSNSEKKRWILWSFGLCFIVMVVIATDNNTLSSSLPTSSIPKISQPQQSSTQKNTEKKASFPSMTARSCEGKSEFKHMKGWIHACYLRDALTPQCKELFDINGYYYTTDFDAMFPDGFVDPMVYLRDVQLCKCELPNNITKQLNDEMMWEKENCKK